MKNLFILFCCVGFWVQCQSPHHHKSPHKHLPSASLEGIDLKMADGLTYVQDTLFSGKLYLLNSPTHDTLQINNYWQGLPDGEWKEFYLNQVLQSVRYFEKGKKTGQYLEWWGNGKPKLAYHFEQDVYQGSCKDWAENGQLWRELHYDQGQEEGRQKVWYENGKLKSNYVISKGRRYGLLGTKNCKNVSDSIF